MTFAGSLFVATRLGSVAVVGYLLWLGWVHLGPEKPEVGPLRARVAEQVIANVVLDIEQGRGAVRNVALLHFKNDNTDYVTSTLRSSLTKAGLLNLRDRTFTERLVDLLNLQHRGYGDLDASVRRGQRLNAEAVLFGTVDHFEVRSGVAFMSLHVILASVPGQEVLLERRYDQQSSFFTGAVGHLESGVESVPWFHRVALWLVFIAVLPIATIGQLRATATALDNRRTLLTLIAYVIAAIVAGLLLAGFLLGTWIGTITFLGIVVGAMVYTAFVLSRVIEIETV